MPLASAQVYSLVDVMGLSSQMVKVDSPSELRLDKHLLGPRVTPTPSGGRRNTIQHIDNIHATFCTTP